jgi:hypothetical protein
VKGGEGVWGGAGRGKGWCERANDTCTTVPTTWYSFGLQNHTSLCTFGAAQQSYLNSAPGLSEFEGIRTRVLKHDERGPEP